jgi:hypothetical protein
VCEARNCWKGPYNIKAFGFIFIPHSLIQLYFSFLYEFYLFILYDSLIMYIVSYQIDSIILVFVGLCLFADTSPKPRDRAWIALAKSDLRYLKGML